MPAKTTQQTVYLISPDPAKIHGMEYAWSRLKILSGKSSPYLRAAAKRGVDITFLRLPRVRGTAELLAQPQLKQKLKQGSQILVFKNTPQIERLAEANGWQILMPPSRYLSQLEDKFNFVEFCKKHRLPALPAQIAVLNDLKYTQPVVVQLRRGHAGCGTHFVQSASSLARLRKQIGEYRVKITPLKKLPTYSLNLCVTDRQLHLTQPFYQLTGVKRLNPNPGGSGGIDFAPAARLNEETRQQITQLAKKVGVALRKIGYRGIAGLDFLVADETHGLYLIEINARLLANLGYITRLQAESSETPLLTHHLLCHAGHDPAALEKLPPCQGGTEGGTKKLRDSKTLQLSLSQVNRGRQEVRHR